MKKRILSILLAAGMSATLLPSVACAASGSYTEQNATLIEFSDGSVTAAGAYSGYEIDGTAVSITEAGTYVLSGACADGSVTVKKEVTGVTLVLDGLDLEITDTMPAKFYCNCSKERIEKAIISVGKKEIQSMIDDGKDIEVKCHFCNTAYNYTVDELKELLKKAKAR